jgi:peroxiredoxin Q/BCP
MTDTSATQRPEAGDDAPVFALPDDTDTIRELAAERGRWVVLFFYPKDFTSGCTTEVCEFRDASTAFSDADATVWGISVLDTASKAAFKEKHRLDYPLLADEDHAVSERYGAWGEKTNYGKTYMGIKRTTFLVDPDGRIARVWANVKPEGHADAVLAEIQASAPAA